MIEENAGVQRFFRYEFKYIINRVLREQIEGEIRNFMTCDGHVRDYLNNHYLVRSLYYDNVSATNYYEKIDGVRTRRKFRLRTYGAIVSPDVPIFLEEKGRHNERTFKSRISIRSEDLPVFEDGEKIPSLMGLYPNVGLMERFVFDVIRRRLIPCVLVDYQRRPYVSDFDMNFRATFDDRMSAMAVPRLFPQDKSGRIESLSGYTILEIKFFRRIPAWFHRVLQAYEMRRLSISKFCKGMEACQLAVNLS